MLGRERIDWAVPISMILDKTAQSGVEGGGQREHSGFAAIYGSNREDRGGAADEVGANSGEHYVTEARGIAYFQREEKLQHNLCALCTKDG